MTRKRQLVKAITKVFKLFTSQCFSKIKKQIIWLLRAVFTTRRKRGTVNAGFVLPTVAMVALVVVLLTTAILFRSFERSKNASNVRVNEIVLRAAAPALDRAKAKLDKLFQDPRLPRSTPSDFSLSQVIDNNISEFTFGDETQLKLVKDVDGDNSIADDETLISAWKYPVDTDNDGKFDSFTLYGIYFRTPTSTRPRSTLEARAQPMDEGATAGKCASNVATSADLVGSQGWYKVGSKLKRSLFVYTTTVPITDLTGVDNTSNKYEKFTGNKGFSSLEYQQDRERLPLTNNAVIYENDLEITPGAGLYINGRIFTNGNLLTRMKTYDDGIWFYQVSSPYSCYYTQENSKIVIAGNVINSRVNETAKIDGEAKVRVDLFKDVRPYQPNYTDQTADYFSDTNKTVTVYGNTAAYNDAAYAQRIARLVQATNALYPATTPPDSSLPDEVKEGIKKARTAEPTLSASKAQDQQLTIYFKKRTRRVPYAEVGVGENALKQPTNTGTTYNYTSTNPFPTGGDSGNSLRPVDEWVFPFDPTDGKTETNFAKIAMKAQSTANKLYLPATDPNTLKTLTTTQEKLIGDRVLVGNNLPQYWYNGTTFVSSETGQTISTKEWDDTTNPRKRFSQANLLDDLGVTERDGFWEKAASQEPTGPLDVVGGLRVVTGAGIYLPDNRTPTSTTTDFTADLGVTAKVWPDSMAMGVIKPISDTTTEAGLPYAETPYLKMRATAVYHYQDSSYDPNTPGTYQTPIACVSSYYDPSNATTAKNQVGLPDFSPFPASGRALTGLSTIAAGNGGNSNNGVVYPASSLSTTGYEAALNYQAALKYPNGRWVNQPLKDALTKITASQNLSLSEQSAVDSAMCALKILDGTIGAADDTAIPHGAIMETAFLDARQVKAIDKPDSSSTTKYNLDVELRQPLEIRATIVNLDLLRRKSKTGGEFLFPNSGIIYATRDDALPDASDTDPIVSTADFKLDPTRRPNGIMLINGSDLSRNATYKPEEKGLILASNLPVYVKGDFNLHTKEEFTQALNPDPNYLWDNFYTRNTLDPNFACRKDQFTTCGTGETWRPATVLADAITILSGAFQEGYRDQGDYALRNNYDTVDNVGNPVFLPNFDADGDGSLGNVSESDFGFDLNGNGNTTDTSVAEATQITASAAAKINGFWDNNFVTSHDFQDDQYSANTSTPTGSSYFNNFVTPIQRRVGVGGVVNFSEYVMEICRKRIVTACKPSDWVISGAGTTSQPATLDADRIYPRRVAFKRDGNHKLILDNNQPIPLGINSSGAQDEFPYSTFSTKQPRKQPNTLWFKTDNAGASSYDPQYPLSILTPSSFTGTRATEQPLLVPVLQIHYPIAITNFTGPETGNGNDVRNRSNTNWLQNATATETNLVIAQGDTPSRPNEFGGGLENFVRYLERWETSAGNYINHKASGSFIEFKRSSYATAPWQVITSNSGGSTNFGYPQGYQSTVNKDSNGTDTVGTAPFYTPSSRSWGYDVALLTQLPDLFSQRFTAPTLNPPNEFYREVPRDDNWVKTLLCAAQYDDPSDSITVGYNNAATNYGTNYKYAVSSDQRPSCP
ncbi:hypothetical protein BV378_32060 [Nostoc sp. RF31YmG]|nr:hypothetical protein BV378_32060 [Nostoc sp. RF31YmG]